MKTDDTKQTDKNTPQAEGDSVKRVVMQGELRVNKLLIDEYVETTNCGDGCCTDSYTDVLINGEYAARGKHFF